MPKCSFQVCHQLSPPFASKPDVTVVVPVRKGGDPAITLKSLDRQSFQNFKIILVHDDHQMGAAYCRNRGWDLAETPFTLFSDDDVDWHPQALARLVAALQNNPGAHFAWGSYLMGGQRIGRPTGGKQGWDLRRLRKANYISTMALWRTDDCPGFDEGLSRHQDWDLYLRCVGLGKVGHYSGDLFKTSLKSGDISSGDGIPWAESCARISRKHTAPAVDVIIPCYLNSDDLTILTSRCLASLKKHTQNFRVILIDNGSENWHQVQKELDGLNYLVVRNRKNLGFVKAINQGLQLSTAPFVVLLNNDTTVTANWLLHLMAPMAADGNVGICGPRTDATNSWQGRQGDEGPNWITLNKKQMLAFFCILMRKECLEDVGVLDERFGVGFGDDDDWCHRCHQKGWKMVFVRDSFVRHHHRTTFKTLWSDAQIYQMQKKAMKKLKRKHHDHH